MSGKMWHKEKNFTFDFSKGGMAKGEEGKRNKDDVWVVIYRVRMGQGQTLVQVRCQKQAQNKDKTEWWESDTRAGKTKWEEFWYNLEMKSQREVRGRTVPGLQRSSTASANTWGTPNPASNLLDTSAPCPERKAEPPHGGQKSLAPEFPPAEITKVRLEGEEQDSWTKPMNYNREKAIHE